MKKFLFKYPGDRPDTVYEYTAIEFLSTYPDSFGICDQCNIELANLLDFIP